MAVLYKALTSKEKEAQMASFTQEEKEHYGALGTLIAKNTFGELALRDDLWLSIDVIQAQHAQISAMSSLEHIITNKEQLKEKYAKLASIGYIAAKKE